MKIKNKLALLKRNTEVREIAGQTFTFYPISVRMLFELRSNMEPLMKGLKLLMNLNKGEDQVGTQTIEETKDPSLYNAKVPSANTLTRVTHIGVPDVSVLKARAEAADKETRDAVEAVLGDHNRLLLGRVLADSLRDEGIKSDAEIQEFIQDPAFDLPLLVEFLSGFFAVNAKVFGPFAERVKAAAKERLAKLTQKQGQDGSDSESQPQAEGQESPNPFGADSPSGS